MRQRSLIFTIFLATTFLVLSCAKSSSPKEGNLQNPQDISYKNELDQNNERVSLDSTFNILRFTEKWSYLDRFNTNSLANSACAHWNSLTLNSNSEIFQIVSDLKLVPSWIEKSSIPVGGISVIEREDLTGSSSVSSVETFDYTVDYLKNDQDAPQESKKIIKEIVGKHIPERLPHLMYFLSKENDDQRFQDKLEKFHNPPTAAQVREYVKNNGTWFEKKLLWTQSDKSLVKTRNKKIIEDLEKLIPGIHSGKTSTLAGKIAFETLEPFSGLSNFDQTHYAALSILSKEVPLFSSDSWVERERELRTVLSILNRANATELPFEEKVCHFALYHRMVGQLIKLKGVEFAPLLTTEGTLEDLPAIDIDPKTKLPIPLATQTIPGLFQERNILDEWEPVVVTTDWVARKVEEMDEGKEMHIRIKDPLNLQEKLGALRYLSTITAYRSNTLFDIFPDAPDLRPRILKKLQKMGIAMFGLALHTLKEKEFPIGPGIDLANARFHFVEEDTADNVAYLTNTVIEAIESLERLRNSPADVDLALLTESQIDSFAKEDGVVDSLEKLLMLLVIESKARLDEGNGSVALKHALDRAILHSQIRKDITF